MPRNCNHMPGAAKETPCPLCKDLKAHGRPITKRAIQILNQQPGREATRTCPECTGECAILVTRKGELMCTECAELADDNLEGLDAS